MLSQIFILYIVHSFETCKSAFSNTLFWQKDVHLLHGKRKKKQKKIKEGEEKVKLLYRYPELSECIYDMLKQVIHHLLLPLSPALFFIILFTINMLHIPYSSQPTNHPTCNKRIYTCTIGTKKLFLIQFLCMYVFLTNIR